MEVFAMTQVRPGPVSNHKVLSTTVRINSHLFLSTSKASTYMKEMPFVKLKTFPKIERSQRN